MRSRSGWISRAGYVAVDLARVVGRAHNPDNPDNFGKDLGVFNMANATPQTLAPALGGVLLAVGSATNQNEDLLVWVCGWPVSPASSGRS